MGPLLAYFALLAVAFFVAVVRPQRRRLAAHRVFLAGLQIGDEVITGGGLFGTIRSVTDDRVGLEIAPGTTMTPAIIITVARGAIAQSVPVGPEVPGEQHPTGEEGARGGEG